MIEKSIKATVKEQNSIKGIVHFENMRGPNGLSAYEIYVANLPEGEAPLSEQEWLNSLNKANYYKQYKDTYTVLEDFVSTIPINIPQYNSTTLLEVYINGLRLNEDEYTVDGTNIVLTLPIPKGTEVHKVVSKTVVATANDYDLLKGDNGATFTPSVSASGDLSWTNDKGLENPTTVNIKGADGTNGVDGKDGADGLGVPAGGTTGQYLVKNSDADNDTKWADAVGISLLDVYPVGSIYISANSTNPGTLFGGTWVAFATGRTLVGIDTSDTDFNTVLKTGGEKEHTLTIKELPKEIWHTSAEQTGGTNAQFAQGNWYGAKTNATNFNQPHNNLQPYITVYMWKRIA